MECNHVEKLLYATYVVKQEALVYLEEKKIPIDGPAYWSHRDTADWVIWREILDDKWQNILPLTTPIQSLSDSSIAKAIKRDFGILSAINIIESANLIDQLFRSRYGTGETLTLEQAAGVGLLRDSMTLAALSLRVEAIRTKAISDKQGDVRKKARTNARRRVKAATLAILAEPGADQHYRWTGDGKRARQGEIKQNQLVAKLACQSDLRLKKGAIGRHLRALIESGEIK
jgi:hypothetical protein